MYRTDQIAKIAEPEEIIFVGLQTNQEIKDYKKRYKLAVQSHDFQGLKKILHTLRVAASKSARASLQRGYYASADVDRVAIFEIRDILQELDG